jgi:tRNA(Leu) C34 or U34 (ribose-2'-O)-methylase TrmL
MYLVTLSRFINLKEKKVLVKELKRRGYKVDDDPWSTKSLLLDKKPKPSPSIASIIELKKSVSPNNLTELVECLSKYKIKKIKTKIGAKVPFHTLAIIQRYQRKYKFDEDGAVFYLEARNENKLEVRFGEVIEDELAQVEYPDLAIESPKTMGEISDFIRMSKIFGSKVYIITLKDQKCKYALKDFLKENSFNKANVEIVDTIEEIQKKYLFVSFSLWGKDTLRKVKSKQNLLLIFGNEKRGLLKSTMDKSKYVIKIGNKSSEPLRATQAAAFAIGYLYN